MEIYKPKGSIKPQAQTSRPPNSDNTIMDDTVAIMDDPNALMGGPTTDTVAGRSTIDIPKPKGDIRIRR